MIGPLTGPSSSDFGMPLRQGIELAIAEINTAGGYLGRPLELVVRDDKGDPDAGSAASQDLGQNKAWWRPSVLQHRRGRQVAGRVPECTTATDHSLFHRHAADGQIPACAELHLPHLGARQHQAPLWWKTLSSVAGTMAPFCRHPRATARPGSDVQEALAARKLQAVHVTRFRWA